MLNDYTECIFDTLKLDDTFPISFYESEEDTQVETNAIPANEIYLNTENNQVIFVRINEVQEPSQTDETDEENLESYFFMITLSSVSCN